MLPVPRRSRRRLNNPARPSLHLARLFSASVANAELRGDADATLLDPVETAFCGSFARRRIADFTAGRLCARLALRQLGIECFPIAINADRTPRWPPGIAGSISHTTGYGCAVAASESAVGSIGVDVEIAGRVTPQLDRLVFTDRESTWLAGLAQSDRRYASTIIFSAKEAFYKCQYPVTRRWLEFADASIHISSPDLRSGTFTVETAYDVLAFDAEIHLPLRGRFTTDGDLVLTGIALRHDAGAVPAAPADRASDDAAVLPPFIGITGASEPGE